MLIEYDEIFDLIKDAKIEEAIEYVKQNKLKSVDCGDADGTTPLQYVKIQNKLTQYLTNARKQDKENVKIEI